MLYFLSKILLNRLKNVEVVIIAAKISLIGSAKKYRKYFILDKMRQYKNQRNQQNQFS